MSDNGRPIRFMGGTDNGQKNGISLVGFRPYVLGHDSLFALHRVPEGVDTMTEHSDNWQD